MTQPDNPGPQTIDLYHYTSLKSAMAIIKSGYFLLSPIESLNDPFEFWPGEIRINGDPKNMTRKEFLSRFASPYRVISLTSDPKNLLMWTHYADKFNGCVLKFTFNKYTFSDRAKIEEEKRNGNYFIIEDTTIDENSQDFLSAMNNDNKLQIIVKLKYKDDEDNTILNIVETFDEMSNDIMNSKRIISMAINGKYSHFSYENEYRIICDIRDIRNIGYSYTDDKHYLKSPLKHLTGIIIGSTYDTGGDEVHQDVIRHKTNSMLSELESCLPESVNKLEASRLILNPKTGRAEITDFSPSITIERNAPTPQS